MNTLVNEVRERLRSSSALDLDHATVERAIRRRMRERQLDDPAAYRAQLQGSEWDALLELVVVPESWLFRDPGAFQLALQHVRACLAARPQRPARLLCVPCAGGEEPYSLAMVLTDAGITPAQAIIHACDISPAAIARAQAGIFTRNAFRADPGPLLDRFFDPVPDGWQLHAAVRDRVELFRANLFALAPLEPYDVVFCRNLMIYFDHHTVALATAKLARLMADDGLLLSGPAEIPLFTRNGFSTLRTVHGYGLRKALHAETQAAVDTVAGADGLPGANPHGRLQAQAAGSLAALAKMARSARLARLQPASRLAPGPGAAELGSPPAPLATPAAAERGTGPRAAGQAPANATLAEARQLAEQGDYAGARRLCEHWLTTDPCSAEASYLAGLAASCLDAPDQAELHWRRCLYLEPEHYQALCHMAALREQAGDPDEAARLRRRASRVFERHGGTALPGGGPA